VPDVGEGMIASAMRRRHRQHATRNRLAKGSEARFSSRVRMVGAGDPQAGVSHHGQEGPTSKDTQRPPSYSTPPPLAGTPAPLMSQIIT
jgi:hypothetical protein